MLNLQIPYRNQNLEFEFDESLLLVKKRNGKSTFQLVTLFKTELNDTIRQFNSSQAVLQIEKIDNGKQKYLLHFLITDLDKISNIINAYKDSGLVDFIEPNIRLEYPFERGSIEKIGFSELSDLELTNNDFYNDSHYKLQWYFKNNGQSNGISGEDSKIESAIKYLKHNNIPINEGIAVGVLDDGLDPNHKDLNKNKFLESFDLIDGQNPPTPTRLLSHGTNVCGVISAIENNMYGMAGINPTAKIIVGRIYGKSSASTNTGRIAEGIRLCV